MSDKETLEVYGAKAAEYAELVKTDGKPKPLLPFAEALPPGGKVLDWGCGAGNSAAALRDMGFDVVATDASPEFAALVEQSVGIKVRVESFEALDEEAEYDGVWASFSLLHAQKADFPGHLAAAHRALKPGGQLYLGMKLGAGEERDGIGRFYAYYSEDELEGLMTEAGFTVTDKQYGEEPGLDGVMWPFILVYAHG
ncbi:Methyltransferase [Candidatus Rhodobacter oscarellae]|uniref:Methyltransferase n=1 Tax=Candidatus Rhodobacter oscarellae TaxID=1675527 RepID=A0A0J9E9E8_9RHOB|nr:class I SAM-dependent methyltransferase [Candidatus Rhodobacter lobularis]KMW59256.1 Methyltransferase [Candidatus Rhodobacter lobularis]